MALAVGLFTDAIAILHAPDLLPRLIAVAELPAGALLALGLWTTIVASLTCLFQLALLPIFPGAIELHLIRSAVALCLALVGPGAWSLDARLFGRRRVEIQNLRDN